MKKIMHVSTLANLEYALHIALSGQSVEQTTRYIDDIHYVIIQSDMLLLVLRYKCGEVNVHSIFGDYAVTWCAEITNELWNINEGKGESLW